MDNFLREIESEDVVIYTDQVYSADLLNKCREIHRKLVIEGKIADCQPKRPPVPYSAATL